MTISHATVLYVDLDVIPDALREAAKVPPFHSVHMNGGKGVAKVTCAEGEIYIDDVHFDLSLERLEPLHPNIAFALMSHELFPESWMRYCMRDIPRSYIPLGKVVFKAECGLCETWYSVIILDFTAGKWTLSDVVHGPLCGWMNVEQYPQ